MILGVNLKIVPEKGHAMSITRLIRRVPSARSGIKKKLVYINVLFIKFYL